MNLRTLCERLPCSSDVRTSFRTAITARFSSTDIVITSLQRRLNVRELGQFLRPWAWIALVVAAATVTGCGGSDSASTSPADSAKVASSAGG